MIEMRFGRDYRIVGLGLKAEGADFPVLEADFTSDAAVELALRNFRDAFGSRIASVVHLVAYSDFTGEDHPRITAPAKLPTPILARLHADLVKWTKPSGRAVRSWNEKTKSGPKRKAA